MRDPKTIPFGDYAEAVLARSLARPQTVIGYRTWIGHALHRLGNLQVGKISEDHLREVLADARRAGLSEKSLANLLGCLRMVLRQAGSPAADRLRIAVPDPDVRPLGAQEVERLRAVLVPGEACDDAILALLGSGLRLAELERLRPQDWTEGQARVASQRGAATKSGRARVVDIATYAWEAIDRLLSRGMPARRTLRRHLERRCRQASIPRVRVHDLRHTRLTLLLLAGAPLLYVGSQAGHHDPAYTMRVYGHLVAAPLETRRRWADAA
jgi:integrase